jgi:predicted nucleic acid-binding protein
MTFLPDTNACISLLRQRDLRLLAKWQSIKARDINLCAVVEWSD